MRTYAKNYKSHPSTVQRPSRADYKNREATEWDVRLDVVNGLTSSKILEHAVAHKDKFTYCFIGAEELPDGAGTASRLAPANGFTTVSKATSEEVHVHIAIILKAPAKRGDVLQLLRGPRGGESNSEYAVPRNPKFTYAGWIAHHSKIAFKLNPDGPFKLYEFGDLPMDAYDESTCWKVIRMINKFGNPEMKKRFKSYSDKLNDLKLAKALDAIDEAEMEAERKLALDKMLEEPPKKKHVGIAGNIHRIQEKLGGDVVSIEQ